MAHDMDDMEGKKILACLISSKRRIYIRCRMSNVVEYSDGSKLSINSKESQQGKVERVGEDDPMDISFLYKDGTRMSYLYNL